LPFTNTSGAEHSPNISVEESFKHVEGAEKEFYSEIRRVFGKTTKDRSIRSAKYAGDLCKDKGFFNF
jgi:hypothetical protein